MNEYTEQKLVEDPAIELFKELGWEFKNCFKETFGVSSTLGREALQEVVLKPKLRKAIRRINPDLSNDVINQAIINVTEDRTAQNPVLANKEVYSLLKDGVEVSYRHEDSTMKTDRVYLIDWNKPDNNDYFLASQFWVAGDLGKKRTDLIGFVNGIPLVVVELKAIHANVKDGYDGNILDYKTTIPQLFWYNSFVIVSNGLESRLGTISSKWEHFNEWPKSVSESDARASKEIALETMIRGTCSKTNILDLVENFIVYTKAFGSTTKIFSKNHQYLGVNNAVGALKEIEKKDGKLGVFWHTQGSGKSFSMIYFCQKVLRKIPGNWTFLIVTDRKELDRQIYKNFEYAGVIKESHTQANNSSNLRELLSEDHRYIFTLIHKFREEPGKVHPVLSERSNIIVITDESHRSQYDILAENMRNALPNASFIAFTGTPLITGLEERTKEVFGDYISIYNFRQSELDGSTVPLYYENRIPELQLINQNLTDDIYKAMEDADLEEDQIDQVERLLGRNYHIITRKDRLNTIASDIVEHFMTRGHKGKAMVVSIDKATALRMYEYVKVHWNNYKNNLISQRDKEKDFLQKKVLENTIAFMEETDMSVIVSSSHNEVDHMNKLGLDIIPHRKRMINEEMDIKFQDPDDSFRIVFVCAMWMTGFDVPSCSTIYLDKPMKGHTLMQAIARANRVYEDKVNGVIVDYVGILNNIEEALSIYAEGSGDIADDAPVKDKEKLIDALSVAIEKTVEFCSTLNIQFNSVLNVDGFERIKVLENYSNKILINDQTKKNYLSLASDVNRIFKAILPDTKINPFIPKRSIIRELERLVRMNTDPIDVKDFMQDIETLLDRSISPEPFIINDESKIRNLSNIDFNGLTEKYKKGLRNIAADELRAAIDRTLATLIELNITRINFREKFQKLIDDYNQGSQNIEIYFEKLVEISKEIIKEKNRTAVENLDEEELAIFDLITAPNKVLSEKEKDKVKVVAKELLNKLHSNILVLDWKKKPQSVASVRKVILESLWDGLPEEHFTDQECQLKAGDIFDHVYDSYSSSINSKYTKVS